MKVHKDYILTFKVSEWISFPKKLQKILFENFGEYINKFTSYTDCERTNSIRIGQTEFLFALELSGTWDYFEKWLKKNHYKLDYEFYQSPWMSDWITDKPLEEDYLSIAEPYEIEDIFNKETLAVVTKEEMSRIPIVKHRRKVEVPLNSLWGKTTKKVSDDKNFSDKVKSKLYNSFSKN